MNRPADPAPVEAGAEQQTPQQFVKAALAAEREQWTGSQVVRCDFGGTCNREHGAQCAAVCRRMRGEA